LHTFAIRRQTRRGQGEEQKLALAVLNTPDQIQGRDSIETPGAAVSARIRDARGLTEPGLRATAAKCAPFANRGSLLCLWERQPAAP
jgi:hypothetical protein